jgi:hypothetical protein
MLIPFGISFFPDAQPYSRSGAKFGRVEIYHSLFPTQTIHVVAIRE